MTNTGPGGRTVLDMNRYQWTVLFAAWLGWGFDVFDGLLFNYVAPNCVPTLLGLPIGSAAAKAATLKWGGILTSILLLGLGGGRHPVRADRGSHRADADAAAHDADVRARHRGVRGGDQHLDAGRVPRRRQPGHRRRVGRRRGDGRRGGAGKAARRSGRAAVHVGADGPVPGDVRQLPDRGRVVARRARDVVAVRLSVRARPRRRRVRRPHVRARSRSAGRQPPRRAPCIRASPSCSRPSTGARRWAGSRWRSSRSSPGGASTPSSRSWRPASRSDAPRPRASTGAATLALTRRVEGARDQRVQPGRPDRHAADDPGREDAWAAARCSGSTTRCPRSR